MAPVKIRRGGQAILSTTLPSLETMRTNLTSQPSQSSKSENNLQYRRRFSKAKPRKSKSSKPKFERPEWQEVTEITLSENEERHGFELRFPAKPSESILEKLNVNKFWRWSKWGGFWYAKRTPDNRAFAEEIMKEYNAETTTAEVGANI